MIKISIPDIMIVTDQEYSFNRKSTLGSDSGQFKEVAQIILVKVPNESAILEHSKNMYMNGVYL